MRKLLLVLVCAAMLLFYGGGAMAELGPWRMYVVMLYENQYLGLLNYGQATALIAQMVNRFSAEPGVADTIYTAWVQDGRLGEGADEWMYSNWPAGDDEEHLPVGWFYMGGDIPDEGVPIDSSEDTDYMLTVYWDAEYATTRHPSGNWTAMMVITNRIFEGLSGWLSMGLLMPYCQFPLEGTPGLICE